VGRGEFAISIFERGHLLDRNFLPSRPFTPAKGREAMAKWPTYLPQKNEKIHFQRGAPWSK